jgi:hypothetical protein
MANPPADNKCELGPTASAGLTNAPIATISLCGFDFSIPGFTFAFGFQLPNFSFGLPFPPFPWLTLNCDLNKPISAGWGGGRFSTSLPCADESNQPDSEDQ